MNPITIKAKDLQLADKVQLKFKPHFDSAYHCATVKQIKDGYATLFRPYVKTDDFSYTGGVICYVGIEEFQVPLNNNEFLLWERKELK